MPTGLLIRDFEKRYREVRYANQGAFRLSEVEHNAYLNRLTIEVTDFNAYRSISYKTLPDNTHWGYCTAFKGTSVVSNLPVKFARQRVFEHINQGIYSYHQSTESLNLSTASSESGINALIQGGVLGEATDALIRLFVEAKDALSGSFSNAAAWLVGSRPLGSSNAGEPAYSYTAFPVASPFPDLWKFKADIPVSFLFRLESWYLVNPAVYILSNPTDTSDETEGEDEYPEPDMGDGSGSSDDFPTSSPNDPENDSRDGGQKPAPPILPGTIYTWSGTVTGMHLAANPPRAEAYSGVVEFQAQGNQFPFTAAGDQSEIINYLGESWSAGVSVKDRFGQTVFVYAPNVGFRRGAHTVSVTTV